MVATDTGAWVLKPEERGEVSLRVTVKGEPDKADPDRVWQGTLQATVPVEWKELPPNPSAHRPRAAGTFMATCGHGAFRG
jgi:hypothetical protein